MRETELPERTARTSLPRCPVLIAYHRGRKLTRRPDDGSSLNGMVPSPMTLHGQLPRFLVLLLFCLSVPVPAAEPAERLALVIGNADYLHADRVPAARQDVSRMRKLLEQGGFRTQVLSNVSRARLGEELVHFGRRATGAETALIYFSGHTIQVDGQNYVIPVDARVDDELTFSRDLLKLDNLVLALNGARQRVLLLDASRENGATERFRASVRVRSVGVGLAPMRYLPRNTLFAFGSEPGRVTPAGDESPSRFTAALIEQLDRPGVSLGTAAERARDRVLESTDGAQRPLVRGGLASDLVLVPARPEPEPTTLAEAPPTTLSDAGTEPENAEPAGLRAERAKAGFEYAYQQNTVEAYRAFLSTWPDSEYGPTVELLMQKLSEPPPPDPKPKTPQFSSFEASRDGRVRISSLAAGTAFRDCQQCPEMVVVPSGRYVMGSPESEPERFDNEGPLHTVRIDYPLAVSRFELRFAEWDACVAARGCDGYRPDAEEWGRGDQPVISVSWEDAQAYVAWLSFRTRRKYRLLSEAEWEYVARAGTRGPFHTGACIGSDDANFNASKPFADCRSTARMYPRLPRPVGSYAPNAWGLHDLAGNLWEWTQDCYNERYDGAPADGSAWEDGDCSFRISRGGGYLSKPLMLRSAYRNGFSTDERSSSIGFRVAASE